MFVEETGVYGVLGEKQQPTINHHDECSTLLELDRESFAWLFKALMVQEFIGSHL